MRQVPALFQSVPDIDRARTVFRLLFAFVRDEACADATVTCFEATLADLLCGIVLPLGGREKLREIYDLVQREEDSFLAAAAGAAVDIRGDTNLSLALISVLIRLSVDDGIICPRSGGRLRVVLEMLHVRPDDLLQLTAYEQEVLRYCLLTRRDGANGNGHSHSSAEIERHYAILECGPHSSAAELRRSYRRLVMRYHPDRTRQDGTFSAQTMLRFHAVQQAYELIRALRNAGS